MAIWMITVRHGTRYQRYHTFEVEAPDVRGALRRAAEDVPDEVAGQADLVEIRVAVDPDGRRWADDGG